MGRSSTRKSTSSTTLRGRYPIQTFRVSPGINSSRESKLHDSTETREGRLRSLESILRLAGFLCQTCSGSATSTRSASESATTMNAQLRPDSKSIDQKPMGYSTLRKPAESMTAKFCEGSNSSPTSRDLGFYHWVAGWPLLQLVRPRASGTPDNDTSFALGGYANEN